MLARIQKCHDGGRMRTRQHITTQVLGYAIETHQDFDASGALRANRYVVRCPRSGEILACLQSLRMAKRFVIVNELGDFTSHKNKERGWREILAA
jgi:hypothetical protein